MVIMNAKTPSCFDVLGPVTTQQKNKMEYEFLPMWDPNTQSLPVHFTSFEHLGGSQGLLSDLRPSKA